MTRAADAAAAFAVLQCLLPAGCGPMDSNPGDPHAGRILALDRAWKDAAARRDLEGMMRIYAPDARELLPGIPAVVGRNAIGAFYRNLMERYPRFRHAFEAEEIVVAASGDLAVVRGTYEFTPDSLVPDEGQAGKFVGVWRRRRGEWRLQMNISNSDAPP